MGIRRRPAKGVEVMVVAEDKITTCFENIVQALQQIQRYQVDAMENKALKRESGESAWLDQVVGAHHTKTMQCYVFCSPCLGESTLI